MSEKITSDAHARLAIGKSIDAGVKAHAKIIAARRAQKIELMSGGVVTVSDHQRQVMEDEIAAGIFARMVESANDAFANELFLIAEGYR